MTFLKRPLAYACVYPASLFASFWSGNDYVTRVRGRGPEPRSDVTCTFAFHEVARMEKEIVQACKGKGEGEEEGAKREVGGGEWMTRGREYGGTQPKG